MTAEQNVHSIVIVAYPGVQQAAALGLRDLFAVADHLHNGAGRLTATVCEAPPPTAAPLSALLLPPSLSGVPSAPVPPEWAAWIRQRYAEGTLLCSVCVGAFVLGELGLLDGRPATTHWGLADDFRQRFPRVRLDTDRLFVDDGDIVTAGGMMAWVDLGLHLVTRYLGPSTMLAVARHLLVDPGGREQRFYQTFSPVLTHGDAPILAAQRYMQAHLSTRITVAGMARRVGLTERTYMRRFARATGMRTTAYLQHLRVHRAREILESTGDAQQEVAWAVGYEDPGAFRVVFERLMGLSPAAYRRRFRPAYLSRA